MQSAFKSCAISALIAALAVTLSLAAPLTAHAAPYCAALADAAALPKKYKNKAPFASDTQSGWIVGHDQRSVRFDVTEETQALWRRIAEGFAAKGVALLILSPPPRPLFAPQEMQAEMGDDLTVLRVSYQGYIAGLQASGLVAPDLSPLADTALDHAFYFARDTHWTPYGALLSAQALARAAGVAETGPVAFDGSYTEKGSLTAVIEAGCGTRPMPERVPAPSYQRSAALGLLDDSAAPEIALVGSSFSGRYQSDAYQVADALSHVFGAEVDNVSLSGGGMAGSMLAFLESGALASGDVTRVVWEVPYTTPLTDIGGLRQVLSLLEDTSAQARTSVHDGLLDTGWTSIKVGFDSAQTGHLEIVTPGVTAGEMLLELFDAQGGKRKLSLRKSDRIAGAARTDRWALALQDLPEGQVSRFKLRLKGGTGATQAQVYLLD